MTKSEKLGDISPIFILACQMLARFMSMLTSSTELANLVNQFITDDPPELTQGGARYLSELFSLRAQAERQGKPTIAKAFTDLIDKVLAKAGKII